MLAVVGIPRPAVAQVDIKGVSDQIAGAIRAGLTLPEGCDQSQWLVRYRFGGSKQEIATTLQTFGYYSPVISAQLNFGAKCWHANFSIDLGPPALIRKSQVEIEGAGHDLPAFREILEQTTIKKGSKFDQSDWDALKTNIENAATRFGFREGHFKTHKALVDAVHNSVDVTLVYVTGPRFHFGKTTFESSYLDQALLRRYVPWHEGEPFDAHELGVLYQSLLDSGYFSDAIIDTSHVKGTAINVDVGLRPARRSKSHIGVGYSTDLGPSVSIGRRVYRVNRRGHQFNVDFSESPVQTKFDSDYRIPRVEDKAAWVSVYAGYLGQRTTTSKTSKTTLGVRRVIPLRNRWVETPFLEISNDRSTISGVQTSDLTIVPGINLSHTHTDSVSGRPQHAHSISIEISGTSKALGSTLGYLSVTASAKLIRAVTPRIRFIGRGKVGAIFSNDFSRVPADVRFFAGGDNSVRGYDFNGIGAVDASGNVIGGNRTIVGSTEFDYLVRPHWAIATFFDAGNVTLSSFSTTFDRSAGIGIRWYSPIGPVRIDFAQPIHAHGKGIKVHISLGPDL